MSVLQQLRDLLRLRSLQLLAIASMLAGLASLSFTANTAILDPDLWWHLKVGDWIVQHHAVPHVGIFSRTAAARPWIAYSWGYEVLFSRAYAALGLIGIAGFGIAVTIGVACTLFWALHRLSGRFWIAWILCTAGCCAFLFSLYPRPVFFSMALFGAMLTLLLEANRTSRVALLYWLPAIFLLWANVHIQFIYGLVVLALFLGVNLVQRAAASAGVAHFVPPTISAVTLLGVFIACVLAGCVGPYSYHLYEVVLAYSRSRVAYTYIQELQALDFASFPDYILLLLIAAAFFAVGWRKDLDLFKLSLLVIGSLCAFRTSRDAWFAAISATACLADLPAREDYRPSPFKLPELTAVGATVAVFLLLLAHNTGFNARAIDRYISAEFPVDAVNFIRKNPVPGPLYNYLDWGGFLIWYMPNYPVAIDGRNDLYGDEMDLAHFRSARGDYDSDPFLKEAGLVLLPKRIPLAGLLTVDPRFRVIYQDQLAIAFAREQELRSVPQ